MAAAYAALVSLMNLIDALRRHCRPPASLDEKQVLLLTGKVNFLENFLRGYDSHHAYSKEADPFEIRIADAAYAAEDAIENYIVDLNTSGGDKIVDLNTSDTSDGDYNIVDLMNTSDGDNISSHTQDSHAQGQIEQTGCLGSIKKGFSFFRCLRRPKHPPHVPTPPNRTTSDKDNISFQPSLHVPTPPDRTTSERDIISFQASLYDALEKVIEEMVLIEKVAIEIEETVGVQQHLLQRNSMSPSNSLRSSSVMQKSSMVGADDVLLQMKDKLTSNRRDLQIIPIVGMGGTGKTTLAINIYEDLFIKEHFDIRAWATISQEYSIRDMLIEVLRRHLNQDIGQNLSEHELGEKLYKHLFGRKYLFILDDVWSIEAWDGVRRFLPNNKNGSRIVITTRLLNLTSQFPSNSNNIEMKLLNEADSWNLFCKTVFGKKDCPLYLVDIGKKIGRSCKGLALSIVAVGGLLAKSKRTRKFWEYIEENLNSVVNLEDDERCLKILHLSYKHLPIYLKPCFLYMGVFLEDEVINVSELVRLWVVEGFLKPISGKSLEELAKEYLEDLISRNLILIHEMGSTGDIEKCKIHDLLRDLCLREAQKERFYTINKNQGLVNGQRRIVIPRNGGKAFAKSRISLARPFIWNNNEHLVLPPLGLRLLRIFKSYNLLPIGSEENVHHLVNSRFLAFSVTEPTEFPSSICLFWNLQTLIVGGSSITAPKDVWYMTNIRHLEFGCLCLSDPPNGPKDDIVLEYLQTLGVVENFKCSEQVVRRIPNITKLRCEYVGLDDDRYCLNNLVCLDKLECFTCYFYKGGNSSGFDSLSSLISFPYSLKKLDIGFEIERPLNDILDKIGELSLLQSLVITWGRFEQGQWETTEGQFRSLRYLTLVCCKGLQVWTTESSHFPCLHQLKLCSADELKEIPLDFAEIPTLQLMEVEYCSDSVVVSAKRILEEQEELFGEASLQVRITTWSQNKEALESLASANFRFVKQ